MSLPRSGFALLALLAAVAVPRWPRPSARGLASAAGSRTLPSRAAAGAPRGVPAAELLDSLTDHAILQIDARGMVTYCNAGATRLTGFDRAELTGSPVAVLFTPGDRELQAPQKELQDAREQGGAIDERWHVRKDGSRFWGSGSVMPMHDAAGSFIGYVKVFSDRTGAHDEQQADRAARRDAERLARMKDEFVATLSHELRTPLNAILGWTHLLRRADQDPAFIARALQVIDRNAQAQSRLVNDLLDMSQMLSGKAQIHPSATDLEELVDAAIENVHTAATARQITIDKAVAGPVPILQLDPNRMQQVLWNLLSNAVKFTPIGGRIEVRLETRGSDCVVSVRDNGAGIRPDFLPFVFDRFSQADASVTRQHGGLGLGLSIVKHLVELHGGRIHADSGGEGQGATFTVTLPLALAQTFEGIEVPTRASKLACAEPPATEPFRLDGLHVLVVDDEPDTCELVRQLLAEHGASANVELSGAAALTTLAREPFDLLISDIAMPDISGYDLIRRLRAASEPGQRDLPALALTSFGRAADRARAVEAGFQAYLSKPVQPSELLSAVAQLTGRA